MISKPLIQSTHHDSTIVNTVDTKPGPSLFAKTLTHIQSNEKKASLTTVDENDSSIIYLTDTLINEAIQQNASDIHIEALAQKSRVRLRCDGLLKEIAYFSHTIAMRLIARLKILAQLNISERRLPQDGRIMWNHPKMNIRVNTCPTVHGEKIVLRLLRSHANLSLATLGLSESQLNRIEASLNQPQGLIIVTGPTGSGKTLTLYAALNYLNQIEKNIVSVEDPVEIELPGINQVSIHHKIGLNFSAVLRNFLRQDPDVIMIGEIRDAETAEIAVQASQTGHLVLTTLHTNSTFETLSRLQSLGIQNHVVQNAVSLIINQRLVRLLCAHCKTLIECNNQQALVLPFANENIYQINECINCTQGYKGRTGVFEILSLNNPTHSEPIQESLWMSGIQKIRLGLTTLDECLRVIPHAMD